MSTPQGPPYFKCQHYNWWKNQKEKTKKDRGIALKVIEEVSSDIDEEEMAMRTRKFKKFFKKAKETPKGRT